MALNVWSQGYLGALICLPLKYDGFRPKDGYFSSIYINEKDGKNILPIWKHALVCNSCKYQATPCNIHTNAVIDEVVTY